jgi:hypothetical protein
MTIIIAFVLGLLAGAIPKGIHIHVHKDIPKAPPKNEKYNESLVGMLPPEIQNYYNTTNGQNIF